MGQRGLEGYLQFSPDGVVGQKIPLRGLYANRMPYVRMRINVAPHKPAAAAAAIAGLAKGALPDFAVVRTILKSPTWHETVIRQAQSLPQGTKLCFVDFDRFFLLLREYLRKENGTAREAKARENSKVLNLGGTPSAAKGVVNCAALSATGFASASPKHWQSQWHTRLVIPNAARRSGTPCLTEGRPCGCHARSA